MAALRISVVMATYQGDDYTHFVQACESVIRQTRVPDEFVIVIDGPISSNHRGAIQSILGFGNVKVVERKFSGGPGRARHEGILVATGDVIAIMDADDLSRLDRLEKQLCFLEASDVDVVGGWISEFSVIPGDLGLVRKVPENHNDIARYAKRRSPMNNVTAMFKKSAYLTAGGFGSVRSFEDYDLYVRMIVCGSRFYNICEILVDVRGGGEMIKRRGGVKQIPVEVKVLFGMYKIGFLSLSELLQNCLIRSLVRSIPHCMRAAIYARYLR